MGPILRGIAHGDQQPVRELGQQPIRNFQLSPDSIKFHAVGSSVDAGGHQSSWTVAFHIFLEQSAVDSGLGLRLKLDFSGAETPEADDIAVAEQYFVRYVARLFSEYAIVSFTNACRLTPKNAFAALVQIMRSQMDPHPYSSTAIWRVGLQLAAFAARDNSPRCGLQFDLKGIQLLIFIKLRPVQQNDPRAVEPYTMVLVYNSQQNSIKLTQEQHPAAQLLQMQTQAAQDIGDCCIWMAVRSLIERYEHRR